MIGYLHTGMEKTGEELTYVQGATNVTRMDYLAPLSNELVYSLAVERLLDIEVPAARPWIRMFLVELNRISSHLLFQATNGMDLGAVSMMLYGWRERELTLRYLEKITGLRMNHNFIRPGGVAADLPDDWAEDVLELCTIVEKGVGEYAELLNENPIWVDRTVGVGAITTEEAIALGATGPILRSTGFPWDLRKSQPYLAYDDVDFDVVFGENGDVYDRYLIRLYEILESVKIVRQCVEKMPRRRLPGPGPQGDPAAARPHRRVDGSADPPLQALHGGLPGPGRRDVRRDRVAPRRDRLLSRLRRNREAGAAAHPRTVLLQPAVDGGDGAGDLRGRCRGDHLEHRSHHGRGGPLMPFTAPERKRAEEIVARYPHSKSALLPLLHMAQERDGWVTPQAMEDIAEFLGVTPAIVLGTCSFYTMFKREHVGRLIVSVCTNLSCLVNGGQELLAGLEQRYADDPDVVVEEVECIANCDRRSRPPGQLRLPRSRSPSTPRPT